MARLRLLAKDSKKHGIKKMACCLTANHHHIMIEGERDALMSL
jgi:hypothetical protein